MVFFQFTIHLYSQKWDTWFTRNIHPIELSLNILIRTATIETQKQSSKNTGWGGVLGVSTSMFSKILDVHVRNVEYFFVMMRR